MTYRAIIARAKRYADTKRGPYRLRFLDGPRGIRIEISDGGRTVLGEMRAGEIDQLTTDEAVARLCEVIDAAIRDIRQQTAELEAQDGPAR